MSVQSNSTIGGRTAVAFSNSVNRAWDVSGIFLNTNRTRDETGANDDINDGVVRAQAEWNEYDCERRVQARRNEALRGHESTVIHENHAPV